MLLWRGGVELAPLNRVFRNEVSIERQTVDPLSCRKLENPAHTAHNTRVFSLTFGDPRHLRRGCLAVGGWLLCNQAAAQTPITPQPAVAFPDAADPNAPPPPPPPPPYATTPQPNAPAPNTAPPPAYPSPSPAAPYPPPPGPSVAPDVYPAPQPAPGAAPTPPPPAYNPPPPAYGTPSYAASPVEAPAGATSGTEAKTGFEFPDFSVRIDPLNWLLEGQLGFELEVEAYEWLTFETVPIFMMTDEPFVLPSNIKKYSNGLGPLSGASISAGFWLEGNSFQGTVIRAGLTNYAYRYESTAKSGEPTAGTGEPLETVNVRENRLSLMLGSGRRIGYFTMAGGMGIEYELNDQRRCVTRESSRYVTTDQGCARDDLVLLRRRSQPDGANLRGPFFPVELVFRFSVGVVFDD